MTTITDAIIVGGGSSGTAIQCALARAGIGRTVLLERGVLAGGPTGRSPAILRQQYGHAELVRMAQFGIDYFHSWQEHSSGNCDYRRIALLAVAGEENLAAFDTTLEIMRECGARVEPIAPADLGRWIPGARHDDVLRAAIEPDAGYCDPHATALSFAAQARTHGAQLMQGVEVLDLLRSDGRVCGVRTATGDILAPIVILAAGPWTPMLAARAGVTLPIRTVRHSVAQLLRPAATPAMEVMLADYINGIYFRPEGADQCLAGSLRGADTADVADPDRFDEGISEDVFVELAQRMVHRVPDWTELGDGGGWSSLFDVTPDAYPLIGPVEQLPGLYVAAGLSGHGFKLCPAIAHMITAHITGQASRFDLAMFSPERFAAGKPIVGRASYHYRTPLVA
ncbi:FAD-binding oxidoreductase [Massilia sp. P8910]|uniref:NAD(P)/FAD-dependent oxidoreductase n=1 Tax=Massilia antarctica TaxID=2765360 RepID=UPI001E47F18F|nr:FAD-binding oxidoreductase [Massilia antarctica]